MFCNQCEQTAKGVGCTTMGVCGKQGEAAGLQDLIVYALRGLALTALAAREKGVVEPETDRLSVKALFTTLTNVNFDPEALVQTLRSVIAARDSLAGKVGFSAASGPAGALAAKRAAGAARRAHPAAAGPGPAGTNRFGAAAGAGRGCGAVA